MTALSGQKTFADICNDVADIVLQKSPATATDNPSLTKIQEYVNDAYIEILNEREWWFLFKNGTFDLVAAQSTAYTMPDTVAEVYSMFIPAKQIKLVYYDTLSKWRILYPGGYTGVGNGLPWAYIKTSQATNNALQYLIFPAADQVYTVEYFYKARPAVLTGTDAPIFPPEYQDVLINRAIRKCFQKINNANWQLYDDSSGAPTHARKRWESMWLNQERLSDSINSMRDLLWENSYARVLDINRWLFYGQG